MRSVFVAYLGASLEQVLDAPYQIPIEELLRNAIPAWDAWQDQSVKKNVRRATKRFLTDILKELQKINGFSFQPTQTGWQISISHYDEIEKIRRSLTSSTMRQLPILFEEYQKPELWDIIENKDEHDTD